MGLNESYIRVISNIFISSPLPSIGEAYSLIIQDENQREIHPNPAYPGESASFIADGHNFGIKRFNSGDLKGQKFNS